MHLLLSPESCSALSLTNGRKNNQDSFLCLTLTPHESLGLARPVTVLMLADGMGGLSHGEEMSRTALNHCASSLFTQLTLDASLHRKKTSDSFTTDVPLMLRRVLDAVVRTTNAQMLRLISNQGWSQSGTTLLLVLIADNMVFSAHLGDSPLFHFQVATWKLRQVTGEHNMAAYLASMGEIPRSAVREHHSKSRLERFVGLVDDLPIPIESFVLRDRDRLMLCSDGAIGALKDEVIANCIGRNQISLEQISQDLLEQARTQGETDNQTIILYQHAAS